MTDVELECSCGKVHGWVRGVSPRKANRVVCYCDDCQAYLHHLGRAELMDAHGGTEIVQVAPSALSFDRGTEQVQAVRLGPKGMYRWHSGCCRTPLGNTLKPVMPFVGIPHAPFRGLDAARREAVFGEAWPILGKFAVGEPPPGSTKLNVRAIARVARLLVGWKLRGRAWPHPFFERTGEPRNPVTTLTQAERDALRPLCGPK